MCDCTTLFLDLLLDCLLQCPKLRHASLQNTCQVWSNDQVNKLCRLIRGQLMTVNLGEIDFTQPQLVSLHSAICDSDLGAAFFSEQTWLIEIARKGEFKRTTIKLIRRNRDKPAFMRFMLALNPKYANYVSEQNFWYNPFGGFWGVIVKMISLEERVEFYSDFQQMRCTPKATNDPKVTMKQRTKLLCQQRAANPKQQRRREAEVSTGLQRAAAMEADCKTFSEQCVWITRLHKEYCDSKNVAPLSTMLEVSPFANAEEIQKGHKIKILKFHPDKCGVDHKVAAVRVAQCINDAKDVMIESSSSRGGSSSQGSKRGGTNGSQGRKQKRKKQ